MGLNFQRPAIGAKVEADIRRVISRLVDRGGLSDRSTVGDPSTSDRQTWGR